MVLRELRELRGLTRREVSELTGINLRSLQDYEQGHKDITRAKGELLYRLSLALGCSIEDILSDYLLDEKIFSQVSEPDLKWSLPNRQIEECVIYSSQYKVYGKWEIKNKRCRLVFPYKGEIVALPFAAEFTERNLPWLVQAAVMKIESYIEKVRFEELSEKLCEELGGENWDEW